jgi:AcrR family transcriptional regulator
MSPKVDVSEERKTQILDAAMDTFAEKGFQRTRMSDIAETSGLSKGALYWYFDSKDTIIRNLLDRIFEPEVKDFKSLLADKRPVEERLYAFGERGGRDIINMLKWMPLVYDFIAMALRQQLLKETISKYYRINIEIIEELIQQGIDSGEFRAVNALDVALAVGSTIEGTVVLWLYDPEMIDIQACIQSNLRILLEGIKSRD